MRLEPGARLGSYEVVSLLGAGGMGEVYRARDAKLQRDVAIKALPSEFLTDADRIARFEREAQALAALSHPAIGGIHELLEHEAQRYLVLEFVEGETLATRLARGALPLDEAVPIAIQIAEALEAAHDKGIIHRDLKPANIMITSEGRVKLLDFGLAKALDPATAASPALSQSPTMISMTAGVIIGTAAYMSPEQARGKAVDRRVDIWAFGCVLFEMLTAKQAFGGETVSDTIASLMRAEPDWSSLPGDTPVVVRQLLHRCLAKDARSRLPHIGVARLDLQSPLPVLNEPPALVLSKRRAPLALWIALALFGVSVAALGGVILLHREPASLGVIRFTIDPPPGTSRFGHASGTRGPGVPAPHFAVSPDGRTLAFSAVADDNVLVNLWVRSLGSTEARKLPGTEDASFPFWSPDSRTIGFFARDTLKTIGLGAEAPLTVCPVIAGEGGTWALDDSILFAPRGSGIWRVPARGGAPVQVTQPEPGQFIDSWPAMLPDGKSFLYYRVNTATRQLTATRLRSLVDGTDVELAKSQSRPVYAAGQVLFMRDGQLFAQPLDLSRKSLTGDPRVIATNVANNLISPRAAFHASDTGVLVYRTGDALTTSRLTWWSRQGALIGTVAQGEFARVNLSPDGSRAVVQVNRSSDPSVTDSDLLVYDLVRNVPSRFTTESTFDHSPIWSPDGQLIAYGVSTVRSAPTGKVWIKSAGGAEPARQISIDSGAPSGWTPDGHNLLMTRVDSKTGNDIWIVPVDGSEARPLVRTSFSEQSARVSPDGRWLAYLSDDSGEPDVYLQRFPPTSDRWRVSPSGGTNAVWSKSGRELFFMSQGNIYVVEISATARPVSVPQLVLKGVVAGNPARGMVDRFAVSPDGQRLLTITPMTPDNNQTPFTVVLNWPELLRKD